MQATIRKTKRDRFVKTGDEFLDVTVDFEEDGVVVETRQFGYPLGTSVKDIKESLAKAVVTLSAEKVTNVEQVKVDATDKQAKEAIKELEGQTINVTFKRLKKVDKAKK